MLHRDYITLNKIIEETAIAVQECNIKEILSSEV